MFELSEVWCGGVGTGKGGGGGRVKIGYSGVLSLSIHGTTFLNRQQ